MNTNKNKSHSLRDFFKHWTLSLFLIPISFYFIENKYDFWLLHALDTLIHEAGHGILGLFGNELIMFMGGTLFQIFIPGLFIFSFLTTRKMIGAQLSFFWLAENLICISIYAADAVEKKLPLIGGLSKAYHDWSNILTRLNMLDSAKDISDYFYYSSIFFFFIAVVVPLFMRKYDDVIKDISYKKYSI